MEYNSENNSDSLLLETEIFDRYGITFFYKWLKYCIVQVFPALL